MAQSHPQSRKDPRLNATQKRVRGVATIPDTDRFVKEHIEALICAQSKFLEAIPKVNAKWFERMRAEVTLTSEFWLKLNEARTVPEAATVCQEWAKRRMDIATEDAQQLFTDTQDLVHKDGERLSEAGLPKGTRPST
jgi:hypothetical protein